MAEPARRPSADDVPSLDPAAVERAYRFYRARRRSHVERTRERRRANIRFWAVLLLLLGVAVYLIVVVMRQVEELFGL